MVVAFILALNISKAQDMYVPPPQENPLFSTTIEEYKRKKFEEKLKLDSERLVFNRQRQKVLAEIQQKNRPVNSSKGDPAAVNIEQGLENLRTALNPETPTLRAQAVPKDLSNTSDDLYLDTGTVYTDTNAAATSQPQQTGQSYVQPTTEAVPINQNNFSRFANSPCFQTLGYIPDDPGLEERYRRCEESKRNDQIAKVSLWLAIIAGLLGAAWFAFKAFNPSKGSKTRTLR